MRSTCGTGWHGRPDRPCILICPSPNTGSRAASANRRDSQILLVRMVLPGVRNARLPEDNSDRAAPRVSARRSGRKSHSLSAGIGTISRQSQFPLRHPSRFPEASNAASRRPRYAPFAHLTAGHPALPGLWAPSRRQSCRHQSAAVLRWQ